MTINVFGNSSSSSDNNKRDLSQYVRKSYIKSNYIETDIDHNIDLKNKYKIINMDNPINNSDSVNKIYVDNKVANIIKKNIQNVDYISFIDNDNIEYKLEKYRPRITLTNISLFNHGKGSQANNSWNYFTEEGDIEKVIKGLREPAQPAWKTGPMSLYEDLGYLQMVTYHMVSNTYVDIYRTDLHNITKIDMLISRYAENNIMGEFTVFYKNSNNEWVE